MTFEFDIDMMLNDSDNEAVPFTRQSTPAEIANQIVSAVQRRPLGLASAIAGDDGTVVLGGAAGDVLDVSASPLSQQGSPGVTGSLTLTIPPAQTGASLDGTTFLVNVDGRAVTFRYTTDPTLTSPDRLVLLNPTDLVNMIATKTANVIGQAFAGDLFPSASGDTVTLGEPSASQTGALTSVNGGTAGLIADGISGGAIAVNFLPTSPRNSIAASLQGAIANSPLVVSTFAPGGGTILIADAQLLQVATGGNPPVDSGVLTPAVTDLAGNPVLETRPNNETRFTIIMPEVVFDLGDAPSTYGTTFADNGPRHTVDSTALPRLGDFVDTEPDGQPVNRDDMPVFVTVVAGSPIFSVDSLTIPDTNRVSLDAMPVGGETLQIMVESDTRVFELVNFTSNPTGSNFAVTFSDDESLEEITTKLVNAIRAAIPQTDDGLLIRKDGPTSFRMTSVDDEDGVLSGVFSDGIANYNVFTLPGTDPNNIQANDVLGFLNPEDPAGTNIAVKVAGAGLLHAWVDFDRSGTFENDEQVLANVPVSGDPVNGSFNFVTVFTPEDAIDGMTWMRVRISESGNLMPTGVTVGGEVEDYPVEIISIALPDPDDDEYTINEDAVLDTLAQGLTSVADGDFIPPTAFLPVQYIAGRLPTNGTLVSLDATTGHFVYQPDPDFNGVDTFTYRLSTQQNASASAIALDSFATVTITVDAVNDMPGGADQSFTAQEDLPLTVSAADLLVNATGDADAQYVSPSTDPLDLRNESLLNELNQTASLAITAVQGTGAVPITASNSASAAGNLVVTPNGSLGVDIQVTNASDGDFVSVAFAGTTATFELVAEDDIAQAGTIPVAIIAGDTPASIANRLIAAIDSVFATTVPPVATFRAGDTVSLTVTPETVTATGSSTFTITPGAGAVSIDVTGVPNPTAAPTAADPNPVVGDTLIVTIAGTPTTFELLAEGATAAPNNIPVTLLAFQDPASDAARASAAAQLAAAIEAQLASANHGAVGQRGRWSDRPVPDRHCAAHRSRRANRSKPREEARSRCSIPSAR